ncbi:hypothetical protein TRFO_06579 [Tritrichomonas foetus]|uniref:Uncharacterized protein n=1 Tax=Tritrichomonas foetus TaxID=1144522 RepID=A0A1J4K2M3_9EUKA|nr:hypothetical protein TRFO_06579 [Tritrichomonas foetus]|eukprot:OHT03741.1 hypothetical protein TRFO_06579 [Tritrichomonas foetus]
MSTLRITQIAKNILPKQIESHYSLNASNNSMNLNYTYFPNKTLSKINFNYTDNPNIHYAQSLVERTLEMRVDFDEDTYLIYNPFLTHEFTISKKFNDILKSKYYSLASFRIEGSTTNSLGFDITNRFNLTDKTFIDVINSCVPNIINTNVNIDGPYAKLALSATNKTLKLISLQNKKINIEKYPILKFIEYISSNNLFTFNENKLKSIITEMFINKSLQISLFSGITIESKMIGFKYDTGNRLFVLRHESGVSIPEFAIFSKRIKSSTFENGIEINCRPGIQRICYGLNYLYNNMILSLGKTQEHHILGKIQFSPRKGMQLVTALETGPMFSFSTFNYSVELTME